MQRRTFLKSTLAAAAFAASSWCPAEAGPRGKLRVGVLGTGLRGQVHLDELLKRADVDVVALCDIEPVMLEAALKQVAGAGRRKPKVYTGSDDAWRTMLAKARLDAVIIATPWELHEAQAIAAMQARVAVGCEVVAATTLEGHWNLLRTQQKTGTPYMLLENVCYRRDVLAVLAMVRAGVFGELLHLEGGYEHDLRAVKFNSGDPARPYGGGVEFGAKGWSEARWRTDHSVRRNGDLYPSHGIGPCAMWADIHRGNRFTRLTSYASKARGLHRHVVVNGGEQHPNATVRFALGDIVTTQIACENGETILLTHDTSSPRPYSLGFRVQGTKGLWMDINQSIHIEGESPAHKWEPAQAWLERNDHPLWKRHAASAEGAGHGGMDFFVVHAFVEALRRNEPMPIDIYDAVAWSAITPLSERSIAEGNRTLDFPDFTEGRWKTRQRIFALDDRY
ncbi:Gfo/Idh/MocA family oxidoreductase [Dokdonella sp.]|uniref:Gfo/Idh/MocA family protein n=1 Tax=Dokdonella sp. TaxID=2291710 RepID=UPI0025B8B937|nr:Gfo/Idh/MocA family oxidoreductase [Dokdonella sp.]MBX3692980.1 Gfo/Idh/MocA family oxidoreductase [Dokdonella sp.]MCW5566708.1 Gfo/Idh/MocA family oxidoreductase [Dokdonella sp.]